LDRLERSANVIDIPLPPREVIADWIRNAVNAGGCGCVRLMATKGALNPDEHSNPKVFVVWQSLPSWPKTSRLYPMIAPWRAAGMEGWAAVKWLCYSVNLHSTRLARRNGFDDALLLAKRCANLNHSKELGLDNQVEGDESIMHLLNKNVFGRAKLLHWLDSKWNSKLEIEWTFTI
jgi:hypothetical protein